MRAKSAARACSRAIMLRWGHPILQTPIHHLSARLALALIGLGSLKCAGQETTIHYGGTDGKWIGANHWYSEQFIGGGMPLRTYYTTPPGTESMTRIDGAQVELTPIQTNPLQPPAHFDAVTGNDFSISNGGLWIHGDVTLASEHVSIAEVLFSSASVKVSSAQTLWTTTGDMSVGQANDSQATLTIENGATVRVGSNGLFLGYGDRSTGTLNVGNYDRTTTGGNLQTTGLNGKIIIGRGGALNGQEGNGVINFNQTDSVWLTSPIYSAKGGLGRIVQRGSGQTRLSGDNSGFSGEVRVEDGVLLLDDPTASPLYNLAGGELRVVSTHFSSSNTIILGSGRLHIGSNASGGSAAMGYLNGIVFFQMSGGVIDISNSVSQTPTNFSGSNGGNENWSLNKSSLNVGQYATFYGNEGNIRVDALSGVGTILSGYSGQGSITFGVNNGSGSFGGVLADSDAGSGHIGRYIKEGWGTQILTGTNTFTGGLTVYGGYVQVNADTGLGAAGGSVTLNGGGIKLGAAFNLRPFTMGNNGAWIDTNGFNATYVHPISGAGAFNKEGDGTLTLTGNNTQGGGVIVRRGTLAVASDANLGGSGATVTVAGGTLALTESEGVNRPLSVGDNGGGISVSVGKLVVWNGNVSGSANATLSKNDPGTLWVGGDIALGSLTVDGGSLVALGILNLSRNAVINSGARLVLNYDTGGAGGHRDFAGNTKFSGAGTLTKTGDGDVHWGYYTNSAAATFELSSGSLIDVQVGGFSGGNGGNEDWWNNKSDLRVHSGATFYGNEAYIRVDALTDGTFGGGTVKSGWNGAGSITVGVDDGSGTFGGVIADTDTAAGHIGTLVKEGTGTQTLTGNNTYTGPTTVITGTLALTGDTKSPSFTLGLGAATLEFNLAAERDYGAVTFEGFGILKKTGPGRLVWGTSTATFALNTGSKIDVQGGTFTGGSHNNDSWTNNKSDLNVATGARFDGVEAHVRVDALTGGGLITSGYSAAEPGSLTFGVDNGSGTFSGVLANGSNPGRFTKAGTGTQILTGANTYTGGTTINAGTLQIGDGGVSGSLSGNITNNAALVVDRSGSVNFDGIISGPGSLTKRGPGTMTLNGANTFSGGTTVTAGTLQLGSSGANLSDNGAVQVTGGTLALGASVEIIGSLTLGSQGTLAFDLSGAGSYERLTISSGFTLNGGTLRVAFANGYLPSVGATFDLLDWGGTLTGAFASLDLPGGIVWNTSNLSSNGTISVSAVPEPSAVGLLVLGGCFLVRGRRRREVAGL